MVATPHLVAGRYLLAEVLGRGGVSDVYRATDRLLGRAVAVKVFRHDGHVPYDDRRVAAEMRTLAALSHPGLVTLFDAGVDSGIDGYDGPYLVMEFVDGPTLNEYRDGGAIPRDAVARIGHLLADALAYIHGEGVVHRDIKPANVLITHRADDASGPSTKLADFGIARVVESDRLTEHGTAVGTAHYLSPEQATGGAAGPASDIYSLGLVLIECVTGRMVFEGSSVASALARLHRDPEIPLLGPAWESLLGEMTSRLASNRPTAEEVARRLRAIAASTDDTAVLATPRPAPIAASESTPARGRPFAMWLTAGVLGAGLLVAGLLWGLSPSEEPFAELPSTAVPTLSSAPPTTTTASTTTTTTDAPPAPAATIAPAVEAPTVEAPVVPTVAPTLPGNGNGNGNNGNGNNGNGNGNGNSNGNSGNSNGNGNGRGQ